MKFIRPKTEKSKKRLKLVFYATFFCWCFRGVFWILSSIFNLNTGLLAVIFQVLGSIGFVVLFVVYVAHIFIEGLEKPQFIPTKTQNKIKNEKAS